MNRNEPMPSGHDEHPRLFDEESEATRRDRARCASPDPEVRRQACGSLYDRYYVAGRQWGIRIAGNKEIGEDLFHGTFPSVCGSYHGDTPFGGYLALAMRRAFWAYWRKEGRFVAIEDVEEPASAAPDPCDEAIAQEQLERLRKGILALDEQMRDVIWRLFHDGAHYADIAEQLGISVGKTHKLKTEAIRALFEPAEKFEIKGALNVEIASPSRYRGEPERSRATDSHARFARAEGERGGTGAIAPLPFAGVPSEAGDVPGGVAGTDVPPAPLPGVPHRRGGTSG